MTHSTDLKTAFQRGAEILDQEGDNTLLYLRKDNIYFAELTHISFFERFQKQIDPQGVVAFHGETGVEAWKQLTGRVPDLICHQAVYAGNDLPEADAQIEVLMVSDIPEILHHYEHISDHDYFSDLLKQEELWGIRGERGLKGFAGVHAEGSIGMIHVARAYRNQGIATRLLKHAVRDRLLKGFVPFSQIVHGNEASLRLHEKNGFIIEKEDIYWFIP